MPPFRSASYSEVALIYDVAQMLASQSGGAFTHDQQTGLVTPGGPQKCDPAKVRDTVREFYDALSTKAEQPYTATTIAEMDELAATFQKKDPLLEALLPGLSRAYVIRLRADATRRATRLLYEIHAYHEKNKKWPAGLNDLAGVADKFKNDPFSGKPFVYKKEGDGLKLYSVAQNARDDGGKHDEKWGDKGDADYVFWPRP